MRTKLVRSGLAAVVLAAALLDVLGWLVWLFIVLVALVGVGVLGAEALKSLRAQLAEQRNFWGFADPSRID